MGTTISSKTLSNMFNGQYRLSFPIDPRTLNTMNKISVFLGYSDWNEFTDRTDAVTTLDEDASSEEVALRTLRNALTARFQCLSELPAINADLLKPYYTVSGSASKELLHLLQSRSERGFVINNSYNPSTFELLESEVIKIDGKAAQIKTREYWLLCWYDPAALKYVERYKELKEQIYVLEYKQHQWKIRTAISGEEVELPTTVKLPVADSIP